MIEYKFVWTFGGVVSAIVLGVALLVAVSVAGLAVFVKCSDAIEKFVDELWRPKV